jgi:hypothetical protein
MIGCLRFRADPGGKDDLEYFTQDAGRYVSRSLPGMAGGSGVARIAISILPIMVIAGIFFSSTGRGADTETMFPFLIMGSVFILSSIIAAVIRRKSHGSGVVVDQMKGTITYRKPGGQRNTVSLSTVREIGIQISGRDMYSCSEKSYIGALIYLMTMEDKRIPLAYSRKGHEFRQFADELSIITSLPVRERTDGEK